MAQRLTGLVAEEFLNTLGVALGTALGRVGLATVAAAVGVLLLSCVRVPLFQN